MNFLKIEFSYSENQVLEGRGMFVFPTYQVLKGSQSFLQDWQVRVRTGLKTTYTCLMCILLKHIPDHVIFMFVLLK